MAENAYALKNVEVFSAGNHRGRTYTQRDLDDIVRNFRRFSSGENGQPLLRVPAVLGHDENQEWLSRSDIPAAAWTRNLRRRGNVLLADLGGVPPQVARLLRGRAYRTVSAEVYDEPPEGIPGRGKMLRRIAFLGGDIPQVKGLADIPALEMDGFCESFAPTFPGMFQSSHVRRMPAGTYCVFSEVRPMSREELIAKLADYGIDQAVITDVVPDALLAEFVRVLDDMTAQEAGEPNEPADEQAAQAMAERARKMAECAKKYLEGKGVAEGPSMKLDPQDPARMSEAIMRAVRVALAEERSRDQGALAEARKYAEEFTASQKRLTIDAFIDSRVAAGKILPAELDEKNPANLRAQLHRADSRQIVHRFAERGKTLELTELDLQMRAIDARPPFKFGERIVSPAPGTDDADLRKLEEHFEMFSEQFRRNGTSKEKLVSAFKAEKARRPQLTADQYLGQ